MDKTKLSLEGSLLLFLVSAVVGHSKGTGGIAGICGTGSFCHGIVDSFGHGLLGTGWVGFALVFGLWLLGVFAVLQHILRNLDIEVRDHNTEKDQEGFTLLAR